MMKKKPHNYDFRLLPLAILCLVFILGLSSKPAFAVDYLVQSGEATLSTAETTKTVTLGTAVDKDHSFFLINSSCVSTTPNQYLVNAELATDGSALLLERNQTGSQVAYVSYSVIQHPDISVQHGTSKLSNTPQYSENITLSTPADPSKSIVILSRRSSAGNNSNHSDTQIAGYLTSSTNLFVQRDTGSTNTPYTWQVVTFNDGSTVQTGEDTFPDDLILAPKTLTTPVDPTRSWLYFTVRCGGSGMSYSMVRGRIADGDTIQFERYNSGAGYNPTVRWFVVEFPSGQGAEVQRGILTTTTTTQLELNDTLASSIDKTQTFLYHTSSGNGNGTAYPRPYWINRYTFCTGDDCTGVQFERWYDGQHGGIAWAAVTMPSCAGPGTPSGPDPSDGATGVSVDADLDWDDAPNATAYDVYFDTVDPPVAQVASDIASSDYTLPTLATSTQYFWKVVAKNACGDVEGPVWDFTTCPPAPAAPSNPSPPDDSTGISVDADLDWDDAADATAYDVYFDTVDPPVTKVGADIATSSLTLDRLICDTHYYWKVVAKNACNSIDGSVWDFVTENRPDPGVPANPDSPNGATDVLLDSDLDWDDSASAESYDVYFGTDADPPLYDTDVATSDYALPTLGSNTLYYWKIVAKNRCANTAGPIWSFTTCTSPGTPSNLSPPDEATGISIEADLDWDDSPNATAYDVYFDTVDPPVAQVASDIASSDYTLPTLATSTQYFWKVVAKNACGDVEGPVWDFTTCPPAPAAPSNPSPPDDSTGISVDADLDWDDAADATAYDVYFDTVDPPVTKVGADIATSSLTLDRLICDTHYYWKVVAKNVCSDVEGPVWDFVTENVADPGMPSNPTPSNGATDVLLDTDLNWDDSTNAESYDVYFGTTYPPPLTDNTATSDYALPTLDADTTYYWKIVAKNRCATTDGPEWSFTTECPVPGTPSGPDPGDGQTDVSIDTDLDWSDAANADTYDVYVDTVDPPVTKVGSDIAVSTYTPSSLLYDTQYFWQIVAKNNCGNSATGPVWDFTTGSEPIGDHFASKSGSNSPPYESWATAAHNIQDAIGAASAGETVLVDDDTFTENVTINKNNLTLQSRYGRSSTFIVGQVQFDASADDLSGCVLDGFDIETSSDTGVVYVHTKVPYDYDPASDFSVTNTTIQNCNIHGNTGTGIMLRGHVSPTISNNNIYDNTSEGIEPYYSTTFELGGTGSPIIIKGNNIYSNGYGGMEIKGYNPAAWNDPPDIIVQVGGSQAGDGNHIHDNDGFFATGVKIDFVDTATIENNIIHHNGMLSYTTMWIGAGIRIDAAVQTTIKGNQIYENDAAGIRLVPNSGFPMPDPDGGGPLPTGNNTITIGGPLDADGNDIHNNPRGGIVFYVGATGGYESVEGSSIQKNYIHHNDYSGISIGVDLDGSTGQRAFNGKITITQNDLAYNGRGGIAIHTGCELEITKNNVHHSTARGGIHTGDDWGLFSRNMGDAVLTIRQNKVHHNFLGGIDIRHATADVINNLIYRNSRVGLRVGPSANQVTSNTFVNNGAIDRGGGMVFDDPYTCDPACEDGEGNCATDCQPYGIPSVPFPVENNISAYNERAGIMACFYSTDIYRDYNLLYSNNQSYLSGWCGDCASPDCSTGDRRDVKKCVGAQLGRGCTDDSVFCCSAPMGGGPLAGETLLFADPVFEDMDNDDYHLDPVAPSPAIGAGMGGADMGAYGGDFPIVDADIPDFS